MRIQFKIIILIILALLLIASFKLDGQMVFSYLKENLNVIKSYYVANPFSSIAIYFFTYILITSLSLPFANIITLLGGALFSFWPGLIIISFASTIGATIAFLFSRYLFKESIKKRFIKQYQKLDEGMNRDGPLYLFTLRVIPAVPFFIINLVMGITNIRLKSYIWVSQVGMLAGTAIYVNAGVHLGELENILEILTPGMIFSLVLLGVFPYIAKKLLNYFKKK
jgi:uncharacterized membrane protein YdjX (TVP38/TMEM64 family)